MEEQQCTLLTDAFSRYLQLFLAFLAISTLWFKRKYELPQRPLSIWILDVSKQGLGVINISWQYDNANEHA